LLRLPNDQPGWLHAALDSPGAGRRGGPLPAMAGAPEGLLPWCPCGAPSAPAIADLPENLLAVVSLRCALGAGLAALRQLGSSRRTLGQAFDDVETGMAIFGEGGLREVARNARLEELLADEPERERLLDLIERQAGRAAGSAQGEGEGCREVEVELDGGWYRLVASRAAAGTLLREAAVVILVDRLSPGLPTTQELRIAFGLRGREPQVALLAAEGLSNAAIAERLRLSAHTVRHYLERVLERLGLHSRKALALHLMAGGGRSQPTNRRSL
jgi:DNA-binding CsgD family transcriptional regulator